MIVLPAGKPRPQQLLALATCGLVLAVASACGVFGDRDADFAGPPPPVVASPSEPTAGDADLHDGRSHVPARWKAHFERFAERERTSTEGGVVFVGSSSIDYWTDLETRFATPGVIRRGLPGGTMADCARYADRLILPYRPRIVVVYAGDNDLADGIAPERIVEQSERLVAQVRHDLPAVKFVFVSIKPSPSRIALMPLIRKTNALMAAYARTDRRLDYVDVFDAMLDGEQHPRRELFQADGLHMNPAGYALWHEMIARHIE